MSIPWLIVYVYALSMYTTNPPIMRATIRADKLYLPYVQTYGGTTKLTIGGGSVGLLTRSLKTNLDPVDHDCFCPTYGRFESLFRWQLVGDKLCFVSYSAAGGSEDGTTRFGHLRKIAVADIESVNKARGRPDFHAKFYRPYQDKIESGPYLNPVGAATAWSSPEYHLRVYFDVCLQGGRLEVFVLVPPRDSPAVRDKDRGSYRNQPIRLVRGDYYPENKVDPLDPNLRWQTVGDWPVTWTGPFYVVPSKDDRFVVSEAGRVNRCPPKVGGDKFLRVVWDGHPVQAIIQSHDHGRWYAFTKDQYFEIADPIKPLPHKLTIQRSAKAEEALETAAKCARLIRGLPEPKKK